MQRGRQPRALRRNRHDRGPTASAICSSMALERETADRGYAPRSPVRACAAKVRTKSLVTEKSLLITARVTPARIFWQGLVRHRHDDVAAEDERSPRRRRCAMA